MDTLPSAARPNQGARTAAQDQDRRSVPTDGRLGDRPEAWPLAIDRTVAHAARVEDVLLGGSAHFEVDRRAAAHAAAGHPGGIAALRSWAWSSRGFLVRVVRWLACEAGVRQFLVVGPGVPHDTAVHTVAQRVEPEARIVYVHHDPVVLAHAHELVGTSTCAGAVAFVHGDVRVVERVVDRASGTLDLDSPVGLLLSGVLQHLPDRDDDLDPRRIADRLVEASASGSYLALCHLAADIQAAEVAEAARRLTEATADSWTPRTRDAVRSFFAGLDLVPPGVVPADRWRPPNQPPRRGAPPDDSAAPLWAGVGRW